MSQHLEIYRGDTATYQLQVMKKQRKEPISGAKIYFTVKRLESDADNLAVISKDSVSNTTDVFITDALYGVAKIIITPTDTDSLAPGDYFWDVQLQLANGDIKTVLKGTMEIVADITRRNT